MIQTVFFLVLGLILPAHHLAISCQVYPSEYACHKDTVMADEQPNANCIRYPSGQDTKNIAHTENYIHCDGSLLRLTDSDLGSEHYSSSDYYVWRAGATNRQLLFIFPTRVNLTKITLHYYRDSARGLQGLRIWAVPDVFKVWDAPIGTYNNAEIRAMPPSSEPAAAERRNVSTNFNLNTRKVLMVSLSNNFVFAVSEVKFFTMSCNATSDDISTSESQSNYFNNMSNTTAVTIPGSLEMKKNTTQNVELHQNSTSPNSNILVPEYSQLYIMLPIALTAAIVVTILIVVVIALLLLLHYKRKHNIKANVELDTTYSTLDRGTQQTKLKSLDASAVLYDLIQLSPSTGQSKLISKSERENVIPSVQSDYHNIGKPHKQEPEKNNSGFEKYAVVDKTKKSLPQIESRESQDNISDKSPDSSLKSADTQNFDEMEKQEDQQRQRKENLEEIYAVVQKKPKKCEEQEEMTPPVPTHTIESLYTAVEKKPKHY